MRHKKWAWQIGEYCLGWPAFKCTLWVGKAREIQFNLIASMDVVRRVRGLFRKVDFFNSIVIFP